MRSYTTFTRGDVIQNMRPNHQVPSLASSRTIGLSFQPDRDTWKYLSDVKAKRMDSNAIAAALFSVCMSAIMQSEILLNDEYRTHSR